MTESEFATIYDSHVDELMRFALSKLSDRDVAKDLVQDVFVRFWDFVRAGKEVENPRAFLFMSVRNRVIDQYRKRKDESVELMQEKGFDPASNEHESIEAKADTNFAIDLINSLDENYRDVLYLKLVEDMSIENIAGALGISEGNVSVRANRGLKKIHELLESKS